MEDRLRQHWVIDHCVLVGDRRPYAGALNALNTQSVEEWKQAHGIAPTATITQLGDDPRLRATEHALIDEVNATVSAAEAIRRFRLLPRPFAVGEELTPTQKVRRQYVLATYAEEVDALYAPPRSGWTGGPSSGAGRL